MKRILAGAFAGGLVMLGTTACNYVDPCTQIPAPTPAELSAVQGGAQVEREIEDGRECDLVNGGWITEAS